MSNTISKTKTLKVNPDSPEGDVIQFAAKLLSGGGLVAFPTETVYGIGVNFLNEEAMKKLYRIKQRPLDKPFTIHISRVDMITKMRCEITDSAEALMKKFWPGPLTIILKSENGKLGFRMPQNTVAKALIAESGVPLAAPSANFSGEKPPTEAVEIPGDLAGKLDLILDGGKTRLGIESTVVDTTVFPHKILREGAVPGEDIRRITA